MYAAIYAYNTSKGKRNHIGNVTNIEFTLNERVYDLNTATIKGRADFEIRDDLIYVINTDSGRPVTAGFTKNFKRLDGNLVSFSGDDFKRILDTDVLIDFTNEQSPSFTIRSIFERVTNAVQTSNRDTFISKVPFTFIIPNDLTDTRGIADYTGQYLIVNAMKFLKVYMAYYGYYIKPYYDVENDLITFEFRKSNSDNTTEIKLKDFTHEKTSNDIKVNKTIATIAYTPEEVPPQWEESNSSYYHSQPENNRAEIESSDGLPPTTGYSPGFALKVNLPQEVAYKWEEATASDFNQVPASRRFYKTVTANECRFLSYSEMEGAAGQLGDYPEDAVIQFRIATTMPDGTMALCFQTSYLKKVLRISQPARYYRLSEVTIKPRPNLPERVYLLGKDNQIYEGYSSIPEDKRIYPVVSKIFEARYLAEAQVNAVYELVNNRYIENIIIKIENTEQPIDLSTMELYSMIRVYDTYGEFKDLPISEKTTIVNASGHKTEIKLGFKKTLLTEIIKHDIGESDVVKSSGSAGGGSTTIIKDEPYIGEDVPDPNDYDTWFKPVSGDDEVLMSFNVSIEEIADTNLSELTVEEEK